MNVVVKDFNGKGYSLSLKKYRTAKELVRTESEFKFFVLFGFAIRNA